MLAADALRSCPRAEPDLGATGFDVGGAVTITSGLCAARLRDLEGARRAAGASGRTIGLLIAVRGALRRVPRDRDARPIAARAVRHLPHPHRARARTSSGFFARRGRVRELLPADAVRAAGARLVGAQDRRHASSRRRRRTVIWAGVAQALATRSAPTPGDGHRAVVSSRCAMLWYTQIPVTGLFWPDLAAWLPRLASAWRSPSSQCRSRALAEVEQHEAGSGVGSDQHGAADRRCDRRRRSVDGAFTHAGHAAEGGSSPAEAFSRAATSTRSGCSPAISSLQDAVAASSCSVHGQGPRRRRKRPDAAHATAAWDRDNRYASWRWPASTRRCSTWSARRRSSGSQTRSHRDVRPHVAREARVPEPRRLEQGPDRAAR